MNVLENLYTAFEKSAGVSIDTRTLKAGEMFFALSGENFNGNKFAQSALDAGASCVVVSDPRIIGDKVILVIDCLLALQQMASFHRDKLNIPVIAITGSNGKTTTKELISEVLAKKFNTTATKGNLNNHIGVPLSLLSISSKSEIAVIEMGANHIGEIALLCSIAKPTHGLITNIGKAHLEGFGGLEGVKIAKCELYDYLKSSNGLAFVNLSAEYLGELSSGINRKVTFEIEADHSHSTQSANHFDYRFTLSSSNRGHRIAWTAPDRMVYTFESALYGTYNTPNIATAIAIGLHFGVGIDEIDAAIKSYIPRNNRSQIVEKGRKKILLDAYNANPVSMKLAISDLSTSRDTKSLILGGMNELGDQSYNEHLHLLEFVDQFEWAEVIIIGNHFAEIRDRFGFRWFENVENCRHYLEEHVMPDGTVLLKGSRSLRLELLLDCIK